MKILPLLLALTTLAVITSHADETPPELLALQEKFSAASRRALDPIERRYVEDLTRLKDRLSREGKLEKALAVDAEIRKFASNTLTSSTLTSTSWTFNCPYKGSRWIERYTFNDDGTMSGDRGFKGTWFIKGLTLRIERDGAWYEYSIKMKDVDGSWVIKEVRNHQEAGRDASLTMIAK